MYSEQFPYRYGHHERFFSHSILLRVFRNITIRLSADFAEGIVVGIENRNEQET